MAASSTTSPTGTAVPWNSNHVSSVRALLSPCSCYTVTGLHQVDLTQDWTNQTIRGTNLDYIEPSSLQVRKPMLWWDSSQLKIFRYGGWPYNSSTNYPNSLWQILTDGTGNTEGYSWTVASQPSSQGLDSNSLAPGGAAYVPGNRIFYALGGNNPFSTLTPPSQSGGTDNYKGLRVYNISSSDWLLQPSDGASTTGFINQAAAAYAPNFGSGFLIFLGGQDPSSYDSLVSMSTIVLYDTSTGTWYQQEATGDIPAPRLAFCSVGVSSGHTFEM